MGELILDNTNTLPNCKFVFMEFKIKLEPIFKPFY